MFFLSYSPQNEFTGSHKTRYPKPYFCFRCMFPNILLSRIILKINEIKNLSHFYEGLFWLSIHFYEGLFESSIHFYEGLSVFCHQTKTTIRDIIIVPRVSSERRKYVPMGFIKRGIIHFKITPLFSLISKWCTYYAFCMLWQK